jgi:hypothetical protein
VISELPVGVLHYNTLKKAVYILSMDMTIKSIQKFLIFCLNKVMEIYLIHTNYRADVLPGELQDIK